MSDGKTHFKAGVIASIISYAQGKKSRNETTDLGELLAVGLFGGAAAMLPDIIDPPTNPNHRSIGHSMVVSGLLIPKLMNRINENNQMTPKEKDFFKSIVMGYTSHFLLDARTPAGLPL